jgi:aerobic-type carbon monoxide dehydrogenase small subunit (CoxS/CutS family)/CO/xanthine dehydrogenase FAD-binding subunit
MPPVLARGIRSYHRPTRLEEALSLAGQGVVPLAGGTRLFATEREVPNVLDLSALGLSRLETIDGDLRIGAMTTLQDLADSSEVHVATAGLLSAAARAHSASRMIRGMATAGGEAVHGAHDSEVVAALLALNTIFEVALPSGPLESPALRFLRDPAEDLGQGGLLHSLSIPGVPQGAALERVAVLPSAPALMAVAVTVSFAGDKCARARIALTGLRTRPARVLEAEARVEGTVGDEAAVQKCLEQIGARAPFRDDAHASAGYRRQAALVLTRRALLRAMAQARSGTPPRPPARGRPPLPARLPTELPYFTSGMVEVWINGQRRKARTEARTTVLDLLRAEGLRGVKHGCETGECGACAVLLDGRPVCACMTLALRAEGRHLETVEGLGTPDALHPVQQAFVDTGAIQCGYCTPAMELCAKALLDAVPRPTEDEVRDALAGCLCRCTGYLKPVQAVLRAAGAETKSAGR